MKKEDAESIVLSHLDEFNKELRWENMPSFFQKIEMRIFGNIDKFRKDYLLGIERKIENEVCWGFGCQPSKYIETKSHLYTLPFGLLIVEKDGDNMYQAPTNRGYGYFMEDFLKYKIGQPYTVKWERHIIDDDFFQ